MKTSEKWFKFIKIYENGWQNLWKFMNFVKLSAVSELKARRATINERVPRNSQKTYETEPILRKNTYWQTQFPMAAAMQSVCSVTMLCDCPWSCIVERLTGLDNVWETIRKFDENLQTSMKTWIWYMLASRALERARLFAETSKDRHC